MNDGSPLALYADELRRARTEAGLSQEALGKAIGYSASLVAGVEQARRNPGPDFTTRCDDLLKTGGRLRRVRRMMLEQELSACLRDWTPVEQEASALRWYEPLLVPGLLQTEEYARALLAKGPAPAEELDKQVAVRVHRQAILARKNPVQLTAVMDEGVLRRCVGSAKIMSDQLAYLVEAAEKPHIHVHIVTADAGVYAGLGGGFVIATLPDGQNIGYMDNPLGGQLVERPADVLTLQNFWEDVRAVALPHAQTIALIEEVMKSWN